MSNIDINLDILRELSEADGIAGCEKEVSRIMNKHMLDCTDNIMYDNLGSIIGVKNGVENGPKIMISAHMDEVGFLVKGINKDGYIKLLNIGGWWNHVLLCKELVITTSAGKKIKGIVAARAPHGMSKEEKSTVVNSNELFLDLGIESYDEAINLGISIGDMVTPNTKFEIMNNENYLMGKAFDDRMGCGILIEVLKSLKNINHKATIYGVGTVQEEVGIRGARTAANKIKPDIAFAIDVTTANDTPLENDGVKLGCGVTVVELDSLTIAHKGLLEKVKKICLEKNIDFTTNCMVAGGTDACNIHKSFEGIITMTISIPTRYMHSHKLIIHRKDYMEAIRLLKEFCIDISNDELEKLRISNR